MAKKLKGSVYLLSVPFDQFANTKVFAKAIDMRTRLYGTWEKGLRWMVDCDHVEWPHDYLSFLEKAGLKLEDAPSDYQQSDTSHWTTGLDL